MKKKTLGSSTSFVHGKEKEIICHDMRKYVWQKYDFLKNKKKDKKKRPYLNWIRALDYGSGGWGFDSSRARQI